MLTLYGAAATRTFRAMWLLAELEIDYRHVAAPPHSDEVRALNPSGKVPVLVAGGIAIADSTAILTYLADREGQLTHAPGSLERAVQDAEMQRTLDELEGPLWAAARHSFVLPEERRVPAIKDSLRWEFSRALKRLSERMGEAEFVSGGRMTIADIVLTHCLGWAKVANFPLQAPRLGTYAERMRARPAFIRAQEKARQAT